MEFRIIDQIEEIKKIFEDGTGYTVQHFENKRLGGQNYYRHIVIKNVDINIPIVFGPNKHNELRVNKVHGLDSYNSHPRYPHIVFESGNFKKIKFKSFDLESKEPKSKSREPKLRIEINGGEYKEEIIFSNSCLDSIVINGGLFHESLIFERGVYNKVIINGGEFKKKIIFGEVVYDEDIRYKVPFPPNEAKKWNSSYNGVYGDIEINGDLNVKKISITKCIIENKLSINSKLVEFSLNEILIKNYFDIVEGTVTIISGRINNINFKGNKVTSKILFDSESLKSNKIEFSGYCSKESIIAFKNLEANSCIFKSFINSGSISFTNMQLVNKKMELTDFNTSIYAQAYNPNNYYSQINDSLVSHGVYLDKIYEKFEEALKPIPIIKETNEHCSIHFLSSDLGKVSFIDSNISSSSLFFKNSKLTEIFLAGSNFPLIQLDNEPDQNRLAISQIKKVYENRGDHLMANEYMYNELEARRVELKKERHTNNKGERVALFLNYCSNKHGQDWVRAFWVLFFTGLFFWILIILLLFDFEYDFNKWNSDNIVIIIQSSSYFFEFFSPIHKFDLLENFAKNVAQICEEDLKIKWIFPLIIFLDFFWRIISGFLVYQLIAAFRKHGKK